MGVVRLYQLTVSPWLPPCCRFTPSCSHYAMEALAVHGAWKGMRLTVWRLLRCQPFCTGGYDPVPPRTPSGATRIGEAMPDRLPGNVNGDRPRSS